MRVPLAVATIPRRSMNRLETAYSKYLDDQLHAGLIRWWDYESMKFRLADNTFYTPDFMVVTSDLYLEAHEVKAFWVNTNKPGWTDDSRVKIKVAAEKHPVLFKAVWRTPDGAWQTEEFHASDN